MPEGDGAEAPSDATSTLPPGHPLAGVDPAATGTEPAVETAPPPPPAPPTTTDTDLAKEVEKWKGLAQKHEARAKANAAAATELEKVRQASMTETEKAVADARAAGRAEALAEVGGQLVVSTLRAAAATRGVDAKVLDAVLAKLNTIAFMGDDGQPDIEAINAFVESIAPPPAKQEDSTDPRWPDLGQGQHGTPPLNSSGLERALTQAVNRG